MFGDIGGGTAIFAAERQSLHQAQRDEEQGGDDPSGRIAGEQSDHEGGQAHEQHRHEEGVLAAPHIPDPPEQQGADRPYDEPGGKASSAKK